MSDNTELKRLAEAFPADLDWDSNTEPFFNGPSGESLGGGSTGFYCVYGHAFEIGDEQYDGPTYVETCTVDFAKFMVAAHEGVLALIAENERLRAIHSVGPVKVAFDVMDQCDQLRAEVAGLKTGYQAYEQVNAELKAEVEALRGLAGTAQKGAELLRKDAERYQFLRNGLDGLDLSCADTMEDIDALIDAAISKGER